MRHTESSTCRGEYAGGSPVFFLLLLLLVCLLAAFLLLAVVDGFWNVLLDPRKRIQQLTYIHNDIGRHAPTTKAARP